MAQSNDDQPASIAPARDRLPYRGDAWPAGPTVALRTPWRGRGYRRLNLIATPCW